MGLAIDLDGEAHFFAVKIKNVRSNGMLSAEV
jgi:hypothetical protein